MLKLTLTVGGLETDYSSLVDWKKLRLSEKSNVPSQLSFSLYNLGQDFVEPVQRAYVRWFSTQTGRSLFTGFVSVRPTKRFVAVDPAVSSRLQTSNPALNVPPQLFEYSVSCVSDEYLLNMKSVPFIPAFVNRSEGAILSTLADVLCSGYFDTTAVASGDIVPFFEYDPKKSWSEIAKQFGDGSRKRYKVRDRVITYVPYGDQPLGISYDETKPQSTFDPHGLQTTVLGSPTVNDVTIIGDTEAGNNREDYFIGDGFTGNFPLRHKMFRGTSSVLLQETWQNAALNTQQWFLGDPFTNFDFSAGALNVVTTGSPVAFSESFLEMNNGIELAGGLNLQHGELTLNDYCHGIVGGIYENEDLDLAAFLGGFVLSTPGSVVVGASGAAGIHIQPYWDGANVGPAVVSRQNHTYVIQTIITAPRYVRYDQVYRTVEGEEFGGLTASLKGGVTFVIQDYDIAAASGFFYQPEITRSSLENVDLPPFAVYALINNYKLNLTADRTTIATMPLGGLSAFEGPLGLAQPTGSILPLLPAGSGNYIGPVLPWPAAASGNIQDPPLLRNSVPTQEVLGNGFDLQAAQITQGNEADTLAFFAQSIPIVGCPVRLQSFEAQAAVTRLQNSASITEEAFIVGDDGIRAAIVSDLNPLPRTSEDCDNAALAYLKDRSVASYNGSYTCTSYFFTGLTADNQYWPTVGRFFNVNAPQREINNQKFLVTSLDIGVLDAFGEVLGFQIGFGADLHLEKVLKHFVDLRPPQVLTPNDTANPPNPRFTQNVDNSFLPDITDLRAVQINDYAALIQNFDGYPYPIEIRSQDSHWGRGATFDYIGTQTATSFVLSRKQFDQIWYMRYVQDGVTSRRSKVIRIRYPMTPVPPVLRGVSAVQGPGPSGAFVQSAALQFDFAGDMRSIYGFELRAADNTTVLVQVPAISLGSLYVDLTQTPFHYLPDPLNTEFTFYAYFFNHQWSYSAPFITGAEIADDPFIPPPNVTTVVGSETANSRFMAAEDQLTHFTLHIDLTSPTLAANDHVTVWLSKDAGVNWTWINQYPYSGTSGTVEFDSLVPAEDEVWKVKVATGSQSAENSPASAVESAGFTITGLQRPAATGVTNATSAAVVTLVDGAGALDWAIPAVTWDDPDLSNHAVPNFDPYTWYTVLTAQICDIFGSAAPTALGGTEVEVQEFANNGTSHLCDLIDSWGYNPIGSPYHYVKLRIYAVNRNASDGFRDSAHARLQTCWAGSANNRIVDFGIQPVNISSVTVVEVTSLKYVDRGDQLPHTTIRISPVVTNYYGQTAATVWLSKDNGVTYTWINAYAINSATPTIDIDVLVPASNAVNWKVAVYGAPWGRTTAIGAATVSAAFAVGGISAPSANGVSSAVAAAVQSLVDDTGAANWGIPSVTWIDPNLSNSASPNYDPNAWYTVLTAQIVNGAGSVAPDEQGGQEVEVQEFAVNQSSHICTLIQDWGFNPLGSVYTFVRLRIYTVNRNAVNGFHDTTNAVVQNCWAGAANHVDIDFGSRASLPAFTFVSVEDAFPTDDTLQLTINLSLASNPNNFVLGAHIWIEIPDRSAVVAYRVGHSPVGAHPTTGVWRPIDLGKHVFTAGEPIIVEGSYSSLLADVTKIRIYASSYSKDIDPPLVRATLAVPTPSTQITVIPPDTRTKPAAGTNVTVVSGAVSAVVLADDDSTGKLRTPVAISVASVPTNEPWWASRLVLTFDNVDPTDPNNQTIITGNFTSADWANFTAGLIPAGPDGINTPHSITLETPTTIRTVTVWVQSGLLDPSGNTRAARWNNIVPGITPTVSFTIGTATGTLVMSDGVLSSLAATMAIVNDLFGVAAGGITNPYVGSLAIGTSNLQALSVTNPIIAVLAVATGNIQNAATTLAKMATLSVDTAQLITSSVNSTILASLAVSAAKMATASVTIANSALDTGVVLAANIANLAVGTAAIANLAVGTAELASAAVTTAKIGTGQITTALIANAAITTALIANAAITSALIASATITGANIASATITDANIASATITSAKIASLDVGKLTTGTMIVSATSGVGITVKYTGSNLQTNIYAGTFQMIDGSNVGLISMNALTGVGGQIYVNDSSGTQRVQLFGGTGYGLLVNSTKVVGAQMTAVTSPSGGATIDTQARTAIDAIRAVLSAALGGHGLTA